MLRLSMAVLETERLSKRWTELRSCEGLTLQVLNRHAAPDHSLVLNPSGTLTYEYTVLGLHTWLKREAKPRGASLSTQ